MQGTVKWFNPTKGFGFIEPADGGPDVFVGISQFERIGVKTPEEGRSVTYEVKRSQKGRTYAVNLVLGPQAQQLSRDEGTVKWFDPRKGYGFIEPRSGGDDIFVHISEVDKAGLKTLDEGRSVFYRIRKHKKSSRPEAHSISLRG